MTTFAVTLSDLIERGGAYAGIAAFFGLAVLSILYFAQAREVRRLRDWAGRAPERAQELEERVVQQAEQARRVKAQPIRRPGEPVTAAATAAATSTGPPAAKPEAKPAAKPEAKPAAAPGEIPAVKPPAEEEEGSPVEHEVVAKPAPPPAAPEAETPAEAEPAEAVQEEDKEAVPAGVGAATGDGDVTNIEARAAAPASPAQPVTPGTADTGPAEPALPPRATQGPTVRRPGQPATAAAPLRSTSSATRRVPPPRRPAPPPLRHQEEPAPRRTGLVAAAALAGLVLIVVGLIAILGGGEDEPTAPSTTSTAQTTPEATTDAGGGAREEDAAGPTRAETSVAVLNGTTVSGLAAGISDELVQAGYAEAQEPTNYTDQARSASVVFYASSEYRTHAIEVAELLEVSDRQPIIEDARALAPEADVVVLLGADHAP